MANENLSVSNQFINAKYNYSALEIDIMLHIIARLQDNEVGKTTVVMWAKELLPNDEHSHALYQYIKDAFESLLKKPFTIYTGKSYKLTNFIAEADIEKNTGKITVVISDSMTTIIKAVRQEFTVLNLKYLLNLEGKHAKRLYLLACQFQKSGNRIIEVEQLKSALMLEDKYDSWKNFSVRVIQPALKEINEKTELIIENTYQKLGRKINALSWRISLKELKHNVNYGSEINIEFAKQRAELRSKLNGYGLSPWQVENVLTVLDVQSINQAIYRMQTTKTPVVNPAAYLWKTFIGMGVPPTAIPKQYDMEDMVAEIELEKNHKTTPHYFL